MYNIIDIYSNKIHIGCEIKTFNGELVIPHLNRTNKQDLLNTIHNIKQLFNKHKNIWNEISFQDMLEMSPALSNINNKLTGEIRLKWRKELKLRMNREGLLGKNMTN